jgi:hypothetical protein
MNTFYSKNFHNFCSQKRYYGHTFLIPPENYIEFLKEVYKKFKNTKGHKSLYELKRLALKEAQKATSAMIFKENLTSTSKNFRKVSKEDLIKIFKAIYEIINPLFIKINHNYKNERRKNYHDNPKYLSIIKTFEQQKSNLINFTLKSICKAMKIKVSHLQEKVSHFIKTNDQDIISVLNEFVKIGKMFALAPKKLKFEEVKEILQTYYENLKYLITNAKDNKDDKRNLKFSLVLINDIIYENFGLEEEQIFAFIQENNLSENKEISDILKMIQEMIIENFSNLFDI